MMLVRISKKLDESLDAWAIHAWADCGNTCDRFLCGGCYRGFSGLIEGNSTQFLVNTIAAFAALGMHLL